MAETILYRCPRKQSVMSLAICTARKQRKEHGCVTCTMPRQVERDQKVISGLRVSLTIQPKTTAEKRAPLVVAGLTPTPLRVSRRVAADLIKKLTAALTA